MRDRPPSSSVDPRRSLLLDMYTAACSAVEGRRAVRAVLAAPDHEPASRDWALIAIGKAAGAMALGALDVLGALVRRGIVISRAGHLDPDLKRWPSLQCLTGDHPVPGAASLAAGQALLRFVAATAAAERVLVLVSGGASSLVEVLPEGISPDELRRVNAWGLSSGVPISTLNAVRSRLSRLKGGRLAALLAHARARALLISDVAGDEPAVIGSGLVAVSEAPLPDGLPDWVGALIARAGPGPAGANLPAEVIGTLDVALAAAVRAADARAASARACSRHRRWAT